MRAILCLLVASTVSWMTCSTLLLAGEGVDGALNARGKALRNYYEAVKRQPPASREEGQRLRNRLLGPSTQELSKAQAEEARKVVGSLHKVPIKPKRPKSLVDRQALVGKKLKFPPGLGRDHRAGPSSSSGENAPVPGSAPVPRGEGPTVDGSRIKQTIEFKRPWEEAPEPAPLNTVEPGIRGR